MKKNIILLLFLFPILVFSNEKLEKLIDVNQVKRVSYLVASSSGIGRSSFGHSYLRFSYANKLSSKDVTIEFVADSKMSELSYLRAMGISFKDNYGYKVVLNDYKSVYKYHVLAEDRDLTSYVLNISLDQVRKLASEVNELLTHGIPATYNFFSRNCAAVVTDLFASALNDDFSGMKSIVPTLVPDILERKSLIYLIHKDDRVSIQRKKIIKDLYSILDQNNLNFQNLAKQLSSQKTSDRVYGLYKLQAYRFYATDGNGLEKLSSMGRQLVLLEGAVIKNYLLKYFNSKVQYFSYYNLPTIEVEDYIEDVIKVDFKVKHNKVYLFADLKKSHKTYSETGHRFFRPKVELKGFQALNGKILDPYGNVISLQLPGEFYSKHLYLNAEIVTHNSKKYLNFTMMKEKDQSETKYSFGIESLLPLDNGYLNQAFCLSHTELTRLMEKNIFYYPAGKRLPRKEYEKLFYDLYRGKILIIPGFGSSGEFSQYLGRDFIFKALINRHKTRFDFSHLAKDWFSEISVNAENVFQLSNLVDVGLYPIVTFIPNGINVGHSLLITAMSPSGRGIEITAVDPNSLVKGRSHSIVTDKFWFNMKTNKLHTLYYGNVSLRLRKDDLLFHERLLGLKENEKLITKLIESSRISKRYSYFLGEISR